MVLVLILYIAAFIFFVLATLNVPSPPRLNFIGAGLACLTLTLFVGRL